MKPCPWELHEDPDREVQRRYNAYLKLKKGNRLKSQVLLRHLIKTDPWFVVRYVFGYWFMDEDLHSKILLQWHKDHWYYDKLVLIPRGHCKTMMKNVIITNDIANDQNMSHLYASDVEDSAKNFCSALAHNWLHLPMLQEAFGPDSQEPIFPSSPQQAYQWSAGKGYFVHRTGAQRRDPSLFAKGMKGSPTGSHPEKVHVDDGVGLSTNNEAGYVAHRNFMDECKHLTGEHGVIENIGTFWSDRCCYTEMISGELVGGRGKYSTLVMPCFEDYRNRKRPIYLKKARPFDPPNQQAGRTEAALHAMEAADPNDFACQMLNDPRQSGSKQIDVTQIDYSSKLLTSLPISNIASVVVDSNAGTGLIYQELSTSSHYRHDGLAYVPFNLKKTGTSKHDRINLTLEPYINNGKFHVPADVSIGARTSPGSLLYELDSVRVAKNDDLADALYMAVAHKGLARAAYPHSWQIYIGVDIATTEGANADWTAMVAVAVDENDHLWLVKYHRFQQSRTTPICQNIFQFCCEVQAYCKGWVKSAFTNRRLRNYSPPNRPRIKV